MRALLDGKRILCVLWAALLGIGITPGALLAADDGGTEKKAEPARPAVSKPEAPLPLTERERWLLDRVEQLEKRVAELEAKSSPKSAAPAESSTAQVAPQTGSVEVAFAPKPAAPNAGPRGDVTSAISVASANSPATISTKQEAVGGKPAKAEPFAFADFTWLNGNARTKEVPLDTKFFTPEIRADISYIYDFNHPKDDTIGGSSEVFRSKEVQVTQLGVGGDFHYDNVRARLMTQFGMYSFTTPRNDASPARGQ